MAQSKNSGKLNWIEEKRTIKSFDCNIKLEPQKDVIMA